MSIDTQISEALESWIGTIDVPPVRLNEIRDRIERPSERAARPNVLRFRIAAAAGAMLLCIALPVFSPALVQSLDARYRAALQALGGIAPPAAPVPHPIPSQLMPRSASLAEAQSQVGFTITPPAGLPDDVASSVLDVVPVGVYSQATQTWKAGPMHVAFTYRRKDGREFMLWAKRYDPAAPPPKYIFEAKDPRPDGRPVIVRHQQFAWRNGDQLMTVTEGRDISASEISTIESAMQGATVTMRGLHAPGPKGPATFQVIPKP